MEKSISLELAKKLLGQKVEVTVDKPIGSIHHRFDFIKYTSNYGYINGIVAPDGDFLDAYILKVNQPVDKFIGTAVAVIHRIGDDDDKLIVIPDGETITDDEIENLTEFQEKWSKGHKIFRN